MAQDPFAEFAASAPVTAEAPTRDPFSEFAEESSSGVSPWLVGAGAVGAGLAGLAFKNPALAKSALMTARKTSMLSGLAPLKSLAGNVGGAAMGSIERGSWAPIKEMLSPRTARETVQAFKRGHNPAMSTGPETGQMSQWNIPGRVMGAMDEAAQNALQRAGYTPPDAAREMLQAPMPHAVGDAFDATGVVGEYTLPFRKTLVNAALEGMKTLTPGRTTGQLTGTTAGGRRAALGTALGVGGISGSTAEDPKTIALTTAMLGRYGLPGALAAGTAYALKHGASKGADIPNAVTDFASMGRGVVSPVMDAVDVATGGSPDPLASIAKTVVPKPAAFGAVDYLRKLLGME